MQNAGNIDEDESGHFLTYEENDLLTANGFTKSMPPGWNIEDGDIFARYVESGVEVPTEKISVTGAIAR